MTYDIPRLALIVAGTIGISAVSILAARGRAQRLMLSGLLFGVAFYSGVGGALSTVSWTYVNKYFLFLIATAVGFHVGRVIFSPISRFLGNQLPTISRVCERRQVWYSVIGAYLALNFIQLIWPEFRLHLLFSPPTPDLTSAFVTQHSVAPDSITRLVDYARMLLLPLFYIGLYHLRERPLLLTVVLGLTLYIPYVARASIGRGSVMMTVVLLILALWTVKPKWRFRIVLLCIVGAPLVFYVLYWYSRVRIGGTVGDVGLMEAIGAVLASETRFPATVGMPLIESGARVDLGKYFTWIVTLPWPKVLTGPIEGARINYEISELILGLPRGSRGWYVVLPGLVAESVYIFGTTMFWLHGLVIGTMAVFFARLAERVPHFLFLFLHVVTLFAYNANRGGIASLLPVISNQFFSFYIWLLVVVVLGLAAKRRHVAISVPDVRR